MNNSFKSGRSITQSIDTVAEELEGPMGEEFHIMSLELLYGLEIDVVFERFAKRIDMEEASYLTASLTILNKTGGDIIKQLKNKLTSSHLLIPDSMLRYENDRFLDDVTLEQLSSELQCEVIVVENNGQSFVSAVSGIEIGG